MNRSERLGVWGRSLPFKSFNLRYLVILLVLMAGLPFLAHAQDATIVGTVTDPSGALMPHVDITLTQVETGRVRVVTTNDSGEYAAPTLQTGHYNVKAEAGGFKVEERQGITLNVNDRTRVDFQMTVGATAESVSVESAPIAV